MKDAIDILSDEIIDGAPCRSAVVARRSRLSSFLPLILLLGTSLPGSCIRDDRSGCDPETTLTILYQYLSADGTERFPQSIQNVDLYIFDVHKNLYTMIPADQASLDDFRGVKITVDPGEYYLVAWGNTTASASRPSGNSYEGMTLLHDAAAATTGPLYYAPDLRSPEPGDDPEAPYRITVVENENNVHTLGFMGAHHTVEIYIKGMAADAAPGAALSGVPIAYDYTLGLVSARTIEFSQPTWPVTVEGEQMLYASFCIPHLDELVPLWAAVHHTGASPAVSVQKFVEDNGLDITDGNPGLIPILFEYRDDGTFVQVTFPSWMEDEVTGGF